MAAMTTTTTTTTIYWPEIQHTQSMSAPSRSYFSSTEKSCHTHTHTHTHTYIHTHTQWRLPMCKWQNCPQTSLAKLSIAAFEDTTLLKPADRPPPPTQSDSRTFCLNGMVIHMRKLSISGVVIVVISSLTCYHASELFVSGKNAKVLLNDLCVPGLYYSTLLTCFW